MRTSSYVLLFSIGLSGVAHAAPTLSFTGSCDGEVTATVTEAGSYRVIFGSPGTTVVPMGICAGTELGISGATVSAIVTGSEISFELSGDDCGASAQVIDVATCETSDVVTLPAAPTYEAGYLEGYEDGYEECMVDGAGEINCFQSAFCETTDAYLKTGLPNARQGNASFEECQADIYSEEAQAWNAGWHAALIIWFWPTDPSDVEGATLGACEE